ncbi:MULTISPECIES: FluC/FEX family fluoride channel [Actinomyces]|uniref:Fluoride-specific ion channel n=1 Tax=Actinomyces respiraculi TaxID=2744574 RepID=A0A7T0PWB9_9ACTO|nr:MULTISPECIES: CrcB family protein [Actinomyces]QPL06216.1 CrcB family protein [Actinomyces respiraculi]
MIAVAVFMGGALGALLRHLVFATQPSVRAAFLVNVCGSFGLGALLAVGPGDLWLAALGTGMLGGLTTFSTVSVIAAQLALSPATRGGQRRAVGATVRCSRSGAQERVTRPGATLARYARAAVFALAMLAACTLSAWMGGALLGS